MGGLFYAGMSTVVLGPWLIVIGMGLLSFFKPYRVDAIPQFILRIEGSHFSPILPCMDCLIME